MDIVSTATGLTVVSLSRKNLEGLLQQLDEGDPCPQIMRATEKGRLTVVATEDSVHYGDRRPGVSDGSDIPGARRTRQGWRPDPEQRARITGLPSRHLSGLEAHSPGADS